jgi:hypothetical protein
MMTVADSEPFPTYLPALRVERDASDNLITVPIVSPAQRPVPAAAGSSRLFRNLEACKVNALLTPANYGSP